MHGGHFFEQSGMSNCVKGLAEVQRDDHYIRVAREQFCNRLENGNNCMLLSSIQLDGKHTDPRNSGGREARELLDR